MCELTIADLNNDNSFLLNNVHSIEKISLRPNVIPAKKDLCKFSHLKDLQFDSIPEESIQILIGANVPEMFCTTNVRKGPRGSPFAIKTPLGWSLLGPSFKPSFSQSCYVNYIDDRNQELLQATKGLWQADFDVGTSILETPNSEEDRTAYHLMQTKICQIDDHYQLPLLWKKVNSKQLPNNFSLARKRLFNLKRRLNREANLRKAYAEAIDSYIKEGYARVVPSDDTTTSSPIW